MHQTQFSKEIPYRGFQIRSQMLKSTAPCIGSIITKLFNQFLAAGKIPSQWKMSTVVPIPKSDNHSSPTNYRCWVSLERHVHHIILDHLEEYFPISNRQWGFTEGKGTVTSWIATVHDWLCNLDQGNVICIIFFDYKKAFDSIPHGPLMENWSIDLNEWAHPTMDMELSVKQIATGCCEW